MLENLRKSIARAIAPKRERQPRKINHKAALSRVKSQGETRMYHAARASRLTSGWAPSTTSADSELVSSLTALRSRSRALVRDAAYAKRAKVIVQNNVIGAGIGMQAQVMSSRDTLRESVNDAIEEAWREWAMAETCHTGGTLHFCDLERALMGQIFEAGEVFVRKHYRSFGGGEIPLALEMIEAERIADEFMSPVPPGPAAQGAMVKMGIEVDQYGRPLAYWIRSRHPGELRFIQGETDKVERVPAEQIMHLRLVERWPQTRGEPWLHAVARKLNDMDGYSEAEIIAARGAANYLNTIETPEGEHPLAQPVDPSNPAGEKEVVTEPGMTVRLAPGELMKFNTPNRPNTALDPFMRYMLREVAAGTGPSYESLSRDYSQSNYSSSRLALLDDRDLWRMLQQWFIRSYRLPLHKEWLQAAVLARAVAPVRVDEYAADPRKFDAVLFKPRGWSWVDPTKEVAAYKEAITAGFTTVTDVIAATAGGQDLEDVLRTRDRELKMMAQLGLVFDTSPSVYVNKSAPKPADPTPGNQGNNTAENNERIVRAVGDAMSEVARHTKPAQTLVTVPVTTPQSIVNLRAGDVHVAPAAVAITPPVVHVENRIETPAPMVNVAPPDVRIENRIETPTPTVNVAPPDVRIENKVDVPQTVVNLPETVVNVAPPDVRIENKVDVPQTVVNLPETVVNVAAADVRIDNHLAQETETVTKHKRDDKGELLESRARTRMVR